MYLDPCDGPLPVNGHSLIDSKERIKSNSSHNINMISLNSLLLRPVTWTANCVGFEKGAKHFYTKSKQKSSNLLSSSPPVHPLKPPSPLQKIASDLDISSMMSAGNAMEAVEIANGQGTVKNIFPVFLTKQCILAKSEIVENGFQERRSIEIESEDRFTKVNAVEYCQEHIYASQNPTNKCLSTTSRAFSSDKKNVDYLEDTSLFLPPGPITSSWPVIEIKSNYLHDCSQSLQAPYPQKSYTPSVDMYDLIAKRHMQQLFLRLALLNWKSSIAKLVQNHGKLRQAAYKSRLITLHFSFQRLIAHARQNLESHRRWRKALMWREARLARSFLRQWIQTLTSCTQSPENALLDLEVENVEMLAMLEMHKHLSGHQRGLIESLRCQRHATEQELGDVVCRQRRELDDLRLGAAYGAKITRSLQRKVLLDADELRRLRSENRRLRDSLPQAVDPESSRCEPNNMPADSPAAGGRS